MKKLRVCVVFGGRSGEHEVSIVSATSVMNALDPNKYDIIPVGITKSGRWIAGSQAVNLLKSGEDSQQSLGMVSPDPNEQRLISTVAKVAGKNELAAMDAKVDVVIPILHGTFGEDGTVQGLLELANLPYVGAGVLGSAVSMDKVIQKNLCKHAGIPVVDFLWLRFEDWQADRREDGLRAQSPNQLSNIRRGEMLDAVEAGLGFPAFVKPANMGSSLGIGKASNREELILAVEDAAKYDHKILIEKAVPKPREIEVSVLGNLYPKASVPGEIVPSNEFYDYDAKYVDGASTSYIPAELPPQVAGAIRQTAIQGFMVCDCEGMARVDFLVERGSNKIYLNEINTIPGFTSISMYPKLWEASGLPYSKLLDELIQLALERHQRRSTLHTSYQPKKDWYK